MAAIIIKIHIYLRNRWCVFHNSFFVSQGSSRRQFFVTRYSSKPPLPLFSAYTHTLLQYYYIVLEIFPRPGLKHLSSQRVCSFLLICLAVQDQGCFSSSIATIWALAANLGLLAPLLVNLLESGSPA